MRRVELGLTHTNGILEIRNGGEFMQAVTRLGNPAASGRITLTYAEPVPSNNPPPISTAQGESHLPPIKGGEDILLSISAPKTYYHWIPLELAPVEARLSFKSDGTPLTGRLAIFGVQGNFVGGTENATAKTDMNGVAIWPKKGFKPFAVPDSSETQAQYTFFAQFWGY